MGDYLTSTIVFVFFRNETEDTWRQLPFEIDKRVCDRQEHEF